AADHLDLDLGEKVLGPGVADRDADPACGRVFEHLDFKRRDQDDSRRVQVLAPNHGEIGAFSGQRQIDRPGLVVVVGTVAKWHGLLDKGRDSGQVDPGDSVEIAPGQVELHQVDRVDPDVDLGDVAVIDGDGGGRSGLGGVKHHIKDAEAAIGVVQGERGDGRLGFGPNDRDLGNLEALPGVGLNGTG